MPEDRILFFEDNVSGFEFDTWFGALRKIMRSIIEDNGYKLEGVNVIFMDDEQLKRINFDYLGHDYYTDVITFDLSEKEEEISGEIYLSLPRIYGNAESYSTAVEDEMLRVIIHGALHLVGFSDKDEKQERRMREEESHYLNLIK
jgi:probable rRNA maturation factor